MDYESWFKFAYITTEISYAVNWIVVIIFWGLLFQWPEDGMPEDAMAQFGLIYGAVIHAVPMITTIINLALTDMALEKSHWWITFITMFPFYMMFNYWGSFAVGSFIEPGRKGDIYGMEQWADNVPLTIFLFFLAACIQSGIHWGTAVIIDRVWPKRASEEFALKENLPDEEKRNSIS